MSDQTNSRNDAATKTAERYKPVARWNDRSTPHTAPSHTRPVDRAAYPARSVCPAAPPPCPMSTHLMDQQLPVAVVAVVVGRKPDRCMGGCAPATTPYTRPPWMNRLPCNVGWRCGPTAGALRPPRCPTSRHTGPRGGRRASAVGSTRSSGWARRGSPALGRTGVQPCRACKPPTRPAT